MTRGPSRKLAVILHADVVGSTTLVQRDEALAHTRIQEAFRRFSSTIEAFDGVAHELRGDALVAEFARASDAVSAGLAFQIEPPEPAVSAETHSRMPRFLWTSVAIVSLTLVAGSLAWWQPWKRESEAVSVDRMAFPLPDKPSIAVLPFDNMSGDPEQEYFVDGMTEDLITDLSKVSGLFVIARHSTFAYKETSPDVRQVANELGVRYVLEGSMRRSGNSIRINAQLIDATTGGHIWAERYDGTLDDDGYESSMAVARSRSDNYLRLAKKNPSPLYYYLLSAKRWDYRQFADAIADAERGIALDPNDPDGYVALAWALIFDGRPREALAAVDRAMRLDPQRPQAYKLVLGMIQFGLGHYESAATAL